MPCLLKYYVSIPKYITSQGLKFPVVLDKLFETEEKVIPFDYGLLPLQLC